MTEWTSISVTEAQKTELQDAKESAGHNGSMGDFLTTAIDSNSNTESDVTLGNGYQEMADRIAEGIDIDTNSNVDIDRLIGRIDDLETQLPRKIAEELQR